MNEPLYGDILARQFPYPVHRLGRPFYLSGVHSPGLARLSAAGADVGVILNPEAGVERHLSAYERFGVDNGCFAKGSSFDPDRWLTWLDTLPRAGCLFVVVPDVFDPVAGRGDAKATWERSAPYLDVVRQMGFPVALALQDGAEAHGPTWEHVDAWDCAFFAGSTSWKCSEDARDCIHEAALHHKWVHVGRVNSLKRLRRFATAAVDSVDGTYLKYGPDTNLKKLSGWLAALGDDQLLWRDFVPLSGPGDRSRHPWFD